MRIELNSKPLKGTATKEAFSFPSLQPHENRFAPKSSSRSWLSTPASRKALCTLSFQKPVGSEASGCKSKFKQRYQNPLVREETVRIGRTSMARSHPSHLGVRNKGKQIAAALVEAYILLCKELKDRNQKTKFRHPRKYRKSEYCRKVLLAAAPSRPAPPPLESETPHNECLRPGAPRAEPHTETN